MLRSFYPFYWYYSIKHEISVSISDILISYIKQKFVSSFLKWKHYFPGLWIIHIIKYILLIHTWYNKLIKGVIAYKIKIIKKYSQCSQQWKLIIIFIIHVHQRFRDTTFVAVISILMQTQCFKKGLCGDKTKTLQCSLCS